MVKKIVKKTAHKTIRVSKRIIRKNPRLKRYAKSIARAYMPKSIIGQDQYAQWFLNNYPDGISINKMALEQNRFAYRPLISIITPTYNTDEEFLRECIDSVQAQIYDNWEMCIVDDASTNESVRKIINEYATNDSRIRCEFSKKNDHISTASNKAVSIAKGEFVALLDHDDLLWPNALFEVVKALNVSKSIDFLYSDEDKITEDRFHHVLPFFKPDWNPEFLRSVNYITHFAVIRKTIFESVGGFRDECNGAQDWDLFLRVTNKTDKIHHIPTILYSWRISENSTAGSTGAKPYVVGAQKRALEDDLERRKMKGAVRQSTYVKDYWTIDYEVIGNPLVSIVIPTKNQYKIIKTCIKSILEKTTYKNYEVVIVDTGTTDKRVLRWYKNLSQDSRVRIIDWPEKPFSYVRSCNEGARQSKGEYLVMLNNDTEVITPKWIEIFLGYAQQKDIGAVGAKLYYPGKDKLIQHAGVGIGFGGYAANALAMIGDTGLAPQQHLYLHTTHNMSAVTAACLMISKEKFVKINGFDEKFRITYNDVDLCLRIAEKGLRNVYTPEVQFIHYESISLGLPEEKKRRDTDEFDVAKELFKKTWQKYITHDPAVNPNISRNNAQFDIDTKISRYR